MRYRSRSSGQERPEKTSGYVYYVRLRTLNGIFYKLGFTSLSSVADRLSRGNKGDEKLIDKVLLFSYHKDAYDLEQRLHSHFSKKRVFGRYGAYKYGPLQNNGQSELYAEDVLSLDEACTAAQIKEATSGARRIRKTGISTDYFGEAVMLAVGIFFFVCMLPFVAAMWLYENVSPKEKEAKNKQKASNSKFELEMEEMVAMLKSLNTLGQ